MWVTWDAVDAVTPAFVGGEDGEDAELGADYEFRCAAEDQASAWRTIRESEA